MGPSCAVQSVADLRKPESAITPTQAIDRGLLDEKMIKKMASRKPGGLKLKRRSEEQIKALLDKLDKKGVV